MKKSGIALWWVMFLFAIGPGTARAESDVALTAGPILSIQPVGQADGGSPYLDRGIGGTKPGLAIGLSTSWGRSLLSLELSSTSRFEVTQSGRFVSREGAIRCSDSIFSGACTALVRHRDTLLTLLVGRSGSIGKGRLEIEAGVSAVLEGPVQGGVSSGDAGSAAITLGVDAAFPVGARVSLVPSARVSHTLGDDTNGRYSRGLGRNIFRLGAGVRVRL
jgi:hypothetical protein